MTFKRGARLSESVREKICFLTKFFRYCRTAEKAPSFFLLPAWAIIFLQENVYVVIEAIFVFRVVSFIDIKCDEPGEYILGVADLYLFAT